MWRIGRHAKIFQLVIIAICDVTYSQTTHMKKLIWNVSSVSSDYLALISLKGLAHAKIIKKSVILFRVLNMTIWCKHVHRLELQIFIIFVLRIHQLG